MITETRSVISDPRFMQGKERERERERERGVLLLDHIQMKKKSSSLHHYLYSCHVDHDQITGGQSTDDQREREIIIQKQSDP